MAKTIKELYNEKVWEFDFSPEPSLAFTEGYERGANDVLQEIIDCFPNSFCINSDEVLGTIAERIKELKEKRNS